MYSGNCTAQGVLIAIGNNYIVVTFPESITIISIDISQCNQ